LGDATGGKKPSVRESHIQGILQGADGRGPGLLETEWCRILLTLQMEGASLGNLTKMDFHEERLSQFFER
jgi:hypothetical protein